MKKNNIKTIKNLITRIISMASSFVVTMIITNIVVSKINEDVYGMYQLSNDFVNYAMVISIALNSMSSRYITISYYDNDNEVVNKYFNSILFANIILTVSLILPIIFLTLNLQHIISIPNEYLFDIKLLFFMMFVNFLITICSSIFGVATFVKNRVDLDSMRLIESNIIKVFLIILLYSIFKPRIWYLGVCTVFSNIYIIFRNVIYTKKLLPNVKMFKINYFDFSIIKELLSAGIWNSFTKISSILLGGLDLIIANNLVSTSAMGILSIAKTIPKYIITSMSSIASVFTPGIMIDYASNDINRVLKTIDFSIKISSIFSLVIEVLIISLGYRVYSLWLPNQNVYFLQILTIIAMMGYIFVMPLEPLWSIFTATNKVRSSSLYLTIESIVTLFFVFILLGKTNNDFFKLLIICGTSSIFEIIRGLTFLPLLTAYYLKISLSTFYKPIFKFLCAFILSTIISVLFVLLPIPNNIFGLILLGFLIGIITLLVGFVFIFSKNDRKKITLIVNKKRRHL